MKQIIIKLLAFIVGYPVMVLLTLLLYLIFNSIRGIQLGHTSLAFYSIPLETLELIDPLVIKSILLDFDGRVIAATPLFFLWISTSFVVYKLVLKYKNRARKK